MALTGTTRGSGTNNTGAASFSFNPATNFSANLNTCAILFVAADNSSSAGATNDFTTVTDDRSGGSKWTPLQLPIFDNGAASAGVQGAIFMCPTASNISTIVNITVNFGSSPTAKTWWLMEIVPGVGKTVTYLQGGVTAGATTTTPSVVTNSITSGNLVACSIFQEAGTTQTITVDDSDSTNGNWANSNVSQLAKIGTTTSGSVINGNWKVVTANGAQTYNVTLGISSDLIGAWVEFQEVSKGLPSVGVGR
jgi:hypothetical protein